MADYFMTENLIKTQERTGKNYRSKKHHHPRQRGKGRSWLNKGQGGPIAPKPAAPVDPRLLRIIPLAGCECVGRNMTVIEYGGDILIVDMGLQFPEEDMPGVDYIIPNISYLRPRVKQIRGALFTHGHLDHIGAVPHLLGDLGNPPIIATPLTMAMIKRRLDDFKYGVKKLHGHQIKSVNERLTLGKFQIEFFATSHNIMDSIGVLIKVPGWTIIHPGDWKFEDSAQVRHPAAYEQLAARLRGQRTILLSDSTGSTKPGFQLSEQEIIGTLQKIITQAQGRAILATFSSHLERIKLVLEIAEKFGKKVAFDGFSMKSNVAIAKQLGYLKFKPTNVIDISQIHNYPDNKVVIVCTGAQGEERASLMRMANGEHRDIKLKNTDTIIFSSSVVPGNERTVQRLKDVLYRKAGEVYHSELMDVHAGGHALAGDMELLLKILRPTCVVPTHGNHYMLKENAKLAKRLGYKNDYVLVPDDGQVISFNREAGKLTEERVPSDYIFVDGLGVGDVSHIVLRDRQALANDGMMLVIVTVRGRTGQLSAKPEIISRGLVHPTKESRGLIEQTRQKIKELLHDADQTAPSNSNYLKDKLRNELGKFIYQKTHRRPMILPVIIEV